MSQEGLLACSTPHIQYWFSPHNIFYQ